MVPTPLLFKKRNSVSDTASINSGRSSKSSLHGDLAPPPALGISSASTSVASSPGLPSTVSASPDFTFTSRITDTEAILASSSIPGSSSLTGSGPTTALQVEVQTKPVFFHSPSMTSLKKYAEQSRETITTTTTTSSIPIPGRHENTNGQYKHKSSPEYVDDSASRKKHRQEHEQQEHPQTTDASHQDLQIGKTSNSIRPSSSYWNIWSWSSASPKQSPESKTDMVPDESVVENAPEHVDTAASRPIEEVSKDTSSERGGSVTSSWSRFFTLSASRPTSGPTTTNDSTALKSAPVDAPKLSGLAKEEFIKSPPLSPSPSTRNVERESRSRAGSRSPSESDRVTQNSNNNAKPSSKSWAFWARPGDKDSEFAVERTSSQNKPYKAKLQDADAADSSFETDPPNALKPLNEIDTVTPTTVAGTPKKTARRRVPNIVTPTTDMCFPFYSSTQKFKSSLSKLSEYILPVSPERAAMTKYHDHLYRTSPAKVRKVVVIGVHGYFPARVIRSIIGEPTGTSIKFANEAAKSVERWADEKGYIVEIEKIALEGEGKVLHRVETLYKLLNNWLHLISEADFVYFAAHSQGTPVAVHLLAKLIEDGHVENKKVALLGMAGISLGPIYGLDQKLLLRAISSLENDSLKELFEFQNPASHQSRRYVESLRTIIAHNAKIVFVGSLNDQLVPLYSSTCAHICHPNIFRSVFIDSSNVSSEFIPTLISIALRLRNIGSSDHGLIKEISGALPGAMTSGGHSRIYDEPRVYDLLIRQALETSGEYQNTPVKVYFDFEIPKTNHNPYLLPWSMRGMTNEARMRPEFAEQLDELYSEFAHWKPEAKGLKDLKYRLGAIKANL